MSECKENGCSSPRFRVEVSGQPTKLYSAAEYISRLAVENTQLHATVAGYRDFVRDLCHALGMSLEVCPEDIVNRVKELKESAGMPAYEEVVRMFRFERDQMKHDLGARLQAANIVAEQRRKKLEKLRGAVDDFVQELADEGFIKLSEDEPDV